MLLAAMHVLALWPFPGVCNNKLHKGGVVLAVVFSGSQLAEGYYASRTHVGGLQ